MIVRVLLLSILIWVVLEYLRKAIAPTIARHRQRSRPSQASGSSQGRPTEGRLIRCAGCGVHIPQARALTASDDLAYCSEACRKLDSSAAVG